MVIRLRKSWLLLALAVVVSSVLWYVLQDRSTVETAERAGEIFELHMVTSESKSTTEDGHEIEAYRWDPGTLYIPKDKEITLRIYGVNGMEHPFYVEGTDIKGTVKKGEETLINLHFSEPGVYRLICTAHSNIENNGPMIAYLIVE